MNWRIFLWGCCMVASLWSTSRGGELDFREDFALATDREAVLKQLIPGTEDFYYFHALHYLNSEQYEKADALLAPWVQRHGETARVWEIRSRLALLTYDRNPDKTLAYLRNRLGLHYPYQRELLDAEPNLPTALDPAQIARDKFVARAVAQSPQDLAGFHASALDWLVKEKLTPDQRRSLLARLQRPDYPTLVDLVSEDLKHPHSGGFGSLGIHRQLLLAQLDELVKRQPELLNQQAFVLVYLTRLQPGADENWRRDPKLLADYLARLEKFAQRLAPVHNSLKAHVLFHQLQLARQQGKYDQERFMAYLQLPRPVGYISKSLQESEAMRHHPCDLNASYEGVTLLPPIGNDEPLVRSYLAHFFLEAKNTQAFEPYVNDIYLRHWFAEVKIVNGLGEPEQWASLLPPELFQQLKERVDIDFAFTNKSHFTIDEAVQLELNIKNVPTLIVKVFEINTQSYYRAQGREIDTDINLDGLVANFEQTYSYKDPPLRRIARKFDFPQLKKPGVYVIDFIGNGRSSRALIRRGALTHLVRTTSAGQSFTVLDEQRAVQKDAKLWTAGHEYLADKHGEIHVPFSTSPGQRPVVLTASTAAGVFSSLATFHHQAEEYHLQAGFYVDRESLLQRKTANLLLRPSLLASGSPVSLQLLDEVKLTIVSTNLDGISSRQELTDIKLFEDRESTHEFMVPPRLTGLTFTLSAKVKKLSAGGEKVEVSVNSAFTLNGIDRTNHIEDAHLIQADGKYVVELRGKTGEPLASRPLVLILTHRDFVQPWHVTLKTNPAGQVMLGELPGIASVVAQTPEGNQRGWILPSDAHTFPVALQGRLGQTLVLPYLPRRDNQAVSAKTGELSRDDASLLELRGESFTIDRFEHLRVADGLLQIEKLPAGDYSLWLKASNAQIRIRITAGEQVGRFAVGETRRLETPLLPPVQVDTVKVLPKTEQHNERIAIRIVNANKFTRVHVLGTRMLPEYDAFSHLGSVRAPSPYLFTTGFADSVYLTGRDIGDEYRYIIDRRYARKFPGNMLQRPELLLNPWAVRSTETGEQLAAAGSDFFSKSAGIAGGGTKRDEAEQKERAQGPAEGFPNLDFLAIQSTVLANLVPNEQGIVEIERAALATHQQLRIVVVDPVNTTYRNFSLPEQTTHILDLRLSKGLNPERNYTEQKQITIVPAGQAFTLHDIATSKFEAYDSLSRVYGLYATLNQDPKLVEFAFILNWPKLKVTEKSEFYSKHASHELNFFLFKKDPDFFKTVVFPYLKNKKDKTFMDHFLLEEDLREYLQPWRYGQLNTAERILLARRMADQHASTARHINELYQLLPPNTDNFLRLFDTAVQRSALETADPLGLTAQVADEALRQLRVLEPKPAMDAPAAPPAPAPELQAAAEDKLQELAKQVEELQGESRAAGKKLESRFGTAQTWANAKAGEAFFDADGVELQLRSEVRTLFRRLEKTMEWAENNYYQLTIDQQNAQLITVNGFWRDYAQHDPAQPFLSRNLAEASRNFPEMLLALAVLDLPFESPKHDTKFADGEMTLTPGGPLVVFHQEVRPSPAPEAGAKVLVSQNFYRQSDRYRQENGEQVDKFISEEFLIHVVYGCQVVITNPTSARQKLNLLLQIPNGSLPVQNGQATRTVHLNLEPYHTQTFDYFFYFPSAGKFTHFPVHVARNETLIATAPALLFNVVNKPSNVDKQSWDYISQHGTDEDVLTFLDKNNIAAIPLERIAWRMRDSKMFAAVTAKLSSRHTYNHTLWSFALLNNSVPAARQYLQHADGFVNEIGGRISSTLLTVDPVIRRTYEHLEYKPLVNARAHALGRRRQIVNDRFFEQYLRLLRELAYEPQLDSSDWLAVTYYLLLQDRVEEALASFERVDSKQVATQLQYDYCAAYLNFFGDDQQLARTIAMKHANHPVDRWRNTFNAIAAQLDEAEGKDVAVVDRQSRDQQQTQLAATEPSLDFVVEGKQIKINYQNIKSVRIQFFEMDVELLFSRNPFVQQFQGEFSAIRANHAVQVDLPEGERTQVVPLPQELQGRNVIVEVTGAGRTQTQVYYAHSLAVQVIENYGQVKVTQQANGKPVSKAYVKVYARDGNGQVKFYKDGYTDLRGRFDYATLSTNDLDGVSRFAILILSDEFGALVREAAPPKQ